MNNINCRKIEKEMTDVNKMRSAILVEAGKNTNVWVT